MCPETNTPFPQDAEKTGDDINNLPPNSAFEASAPNTQGTHTTPQNTPPDGAPEFAQPPAAGTPPPAETPAARPPQFAPAPAPGAATPPGTAQLAAASAHQPTAAPGTQPGLYYYTPPKPEPRQPLTVTRADAFFALFAVLCGFLFVRWAVFSLTLGGGWCMTVLAFLFAGGVLLYARGKGLRPEKNSWYWLAIFLLCGIAYSLWPAGPLAFAQGLLFLGSGLYWCGALFGILLEKKTGNLIALDFLNLAVFVPLANLDAGPRSLKGLSTGKKREGKLFRRRVLPVALGLGLCVPLLAIVLPMLSTADTTGFGALVTGACNWLLSFNFFEILPREITHILWQLFFGLPLALCLAALVTGAAHKRYTAVLDAKAARRALAAAAVVPPITFLVLLGVVCAVYIVFIGCQVPYFFSAFAGIKPAAYTVYSAYAREGFFELCRIAAINLGLMAVCNAFTRKGESRNAALRFFNILLSVLTLLVICTAFSKMGLYIGMHGYTPKRVMTCVFMVFLAGVCGAAILRQFKSFSVMRFAAVFGSGLLCALCLSGLDGTVVRLNANLYLNGRLDTFDELIVWRSGPAGVAPALKVYQAMAADGAEKHQEEMQRLAYALDANGRGAWRHKGACTDTLTRFFTRRAAIPYAATTAQLEARGTLFYQCHKNQLTYSECSLLGRYESEPPHSSL